MTKEQKQAASLAKRRFGTDKVLELHNDYQFTVDAWEGELSALNDVSFSELAAYLNNES